MDCIGTTTVGLLLSVVLSCHVFLCVGGRRRIQELSMITKNQKETKKEVFEYDSHDESLDERSTLSEDSGDEGDSEASYGEEESEENKGLEYLVSGKRIEEVHKLSHYLLLILCNTQCTCTINFRS